MQVTLTKVFRDNVETKYGIRAKVAIQTAEHGDKWLSTLLQPNKLMGTDSWEAGDSVSIDVTEKGDFLNFKPTDGPSGPSLEERVGKLEAAVFNESPSQDDVIQADDLPDLEEEDGAGF